MRHSRSRKAKRLDNDRFAVSCDTARLPEWYRGQRGCRHSRGLWWQQHRDAGSHRRRDEGGRGKYARDSRGDKRYRRTRRNDGRRRDHRTGRFGGDERDNGGWERRRAEWPGRRDDSLRRGSLAHRRERQRRWTDARRLQLLEKDRQRRGRHRGRQPAIHGRCQVLRRRIQPGHQRETDGKTDYRGQSELRPRPVRYQPNALRQRNHREVQDANGRGERRGRGDLQPRFQVRLLSDHARQVLLARHH